MYLTGRVVDYNTGDGLPGATISIDGKGVTISDSNGFFTVNTSTNGINLTASYVGYDSNTLPADMVSSNALITLQKSDTSLPLVSVVAKLKANPLPYAAAAAGLALLLFADKKKKKMGKIDTTTILLIVAGAAGIYLLTRPRTPVYGQVPVYGSQVPAYNPYLNPAASNPVAGDIAAAGGAASSILDAISRL